ncbi:YbaB/EbfC family nucleoid-associated protein [Actinoplanes sp. NPDC051851]|uniref:YbaB/EbfC family nucleoid-associated protein n=1 Tax=Actinoplanes sp. NPDC051851 TaxID=3154753 RepID=UPI00342EB2B0
MEERLASYAAVGRRYSRSSEAGAAARMLEAAQEMRRGFDELFAETVEATDDAGYVTATVTLAGRVEAVRISAYAMRDLDAGALGEACQAAVLAARAVASEQLKERIGPPPADLVGVDPTTLLRY